MLSRIALSDPSVVVTAAIAPLSAEPRAASTQLSQRLAGHLLAVMENRSPWLRVRGEDDYEGWVHEGFVRCLGSPSEAETFRRGMVSLGCTVRQANGRRLQLPLGARIASGVVESGEVIEAELLVSRFPGNGASVASSALELFEGAPYEWGGITPWGADCSGFVQSCFSLHGVLLPRDAWQQAKCGSDAAHDLALLEPGDLAFFSDREDRRVTHVAVALGDSRLVHLALGRGGHAIEDAGGSRDTYVEGLVERFVCARRVAGQ
ncbi:MAG: NlpC/P60 family protein [Gemmatimonadaceae bacterium]